MCTRCPTPARATASRTRLVPPTPSSSRYPRRCEGWNPQARWTTASTPVSSRTSVSTAAVSVRSTAAHRTPGHHPSWGSRRASPVTSWPPSPVNLLRTAVPTLPVAPVTAMRMRRSSLNRSPQPCDARVAVTRPPTVLAEAGYLPPQTDDERVETRWRTSGRQGCQEVRTSHAADPAADPARARGHGRDRGGDLLPVVIRVSG